MEKIKMFEPQNLPDNTIHNASVRRSENGKLQMLMTAPLIEQYSKPDPKTEYRKGVYMRFFDGYNKPTATLRARYAVTYENRDLMMVKDSVVIVDIGTGDTVYLQDLTWNAAEHRIFSDKPVRSKNGRRITLGDSFESDDAFESPQIVHQRGTLEWKEE
ncbi:MAG: LPS export ABC transporter periplasmic protein LptC [Bacteroidales bacterium]|nr:LPS export ABC transporter periplasmic protein LptC [Bacteroidales bacterium]